MLDPIEIKRLYVEERFSLRMIADRFESNHHMIRRILERQGVGISKHNRLRKEISQDVHDKMAENLKSRYASGELKIWCTGKKLTREHVLRSMQSKLMCDVSIEWLQSFTNFEKLRFLSRVTTRHRKHFATEKYIAFIEHFYNDPKFNEIYDKWWENDCNKWLIPSIDHINPLSKGGSFDLDNLRFITWFENKAKGDMPLEEWEEVKANISDYFI
jgi:hypothetical protein